MTSAVLSMLFGSAFCALAAALLQMLLCDPVSDSDEENKE